MEYKLLEEQKEEVFNLNELLDIVNTTERNEFIEG